MRLRYKVAIAITITIVLISSVLYAYYVTAKPFTKITDLRIETTNKEWKECEKYLVKLEITLPRVPSEHPQFLGVTVYLNWTLIYDVKIVNVTARPILEEIKMEVVLLVHPQRGIVGAKVCLKFDLVMIVEVDIEHPTLLGSKHTRISAKTPPVSVILCG